MEPIKIQTEIELTQEDIDDIVCTALEGGVNYWCKRATIVKCDKLPKDLEYTSQAISRGLSVLLEDEDGEWKKDAARFTLTLDSLKAGLRLYASKYGLVDVGDIDSPAADSIIQLALFSKEIYG
jgi:hypothetical protein